MFLEQSQKLLLEGHLPVVLCQALDVLHARRSAVPAGLMQRRTCVPNVETLGYCRRVPPGQTPAGAKSCTASGPLRPGLRRPAAGIRIRPEGGQAGMFLLSADAAAGIFSCLMRVDSPIRSVQVLRHWYPLPSNQS